MPAGIFEIKNQNAKIKIEESAEPTTKINRFLL